MSNVKKFVMFEHIWWEASLTLSESDSLHTWGSSCPAAAAGGRPDLAWGPRGSGLVQVWWWCRHPGALLLGCADWGTDITQIVNTQSHTATSPVNICAKKNINHLQNVEQDFAPDIQGPFPNLVYLIPSRVHVLVETFRRTNVRQGRKEGSLRN